MKNKDKHKRHENVLLDKTEANGKVLFWSEILFLAAVGLLYSLHFLQHFVFPNSDFVSFLETGQRWLSFQIPANMKRAPLFAIITALSSEIFNYPGGSLFGTGLYNALMLPTAMILIYLIAREFLGRAAVWIALLAGISPMMVNLSSDLLAELTIIVMLAATAYSVSKQSRWAYVFAMLGSVTRWDLVPLLAIVVLIDIIRTRRWLKPIISCAVASIPFALCLLITLTRFEAQKKGEHYLYILSDERSFELMKDLAMYSQQICSFFLAPIFTNDSQGNVIPSEQLNQMIFRLCSVVLAVTVIAGIVLSFRKKQWSLIALILAAVPYISVHAFYPFHIIRFSVPFAWVGLLLSAYALKTFWQWFCSLSKPPFINPALKIIAAVLFSIWAVKLFQTLGFSQKQCPVIMRLTVISLIVVAAFFFINQWLRKTKFSLSWLTVLSFLVLAITSNAATTGFIMGSGQNDATFKKLMLWFYENAKPDDKMLTTMAGFGPVYTNMPQSKFVHISSIDPEQAKDFDQFVAKCRELGVTLIAWDSRLYNKTTDRYYRIWAMGRWDPLAAPFLGKKVTQVGPCQLIHIIADGRPGIAVYRILPNAIIPAQAPIQ